MASMFSWHRLFLRVANAGALLFAWILVFEYFSATLSPGDAAAYTAGAFCLAYLVSFALTPLSACAVRNGVKLLATKAILVLAISYALLGLTLWGAVATWELWGIAAFATLFGVYRAFYWISYQSHMNADIRGWSSNVVIALMPLAFGYAVAFAPHPAFVLALATILVVLSLIPHLFTSDIVERYPWGALETFREFIRPTYRRVVVRSFIDGANAAALFLLWPLAVYMLLDRSYALLGIVFSITLLFVLFARYFMRRFFSASVFYAPTVRAAHFVSAWVFRLIAATPVAIIAAGVYANAYGSDRDETDVFAFEHYADQGVYLDEHTTLKEMGASLGRVVLGILFGVLALYVSIPVAFAILFILVGVLSGAMFFVGRGSVLY